MGAPSPKKRTPKRKTTINDPVWKTGYEEGWRDCRKDALDFLETEYMNPLITRDSDEAKAILEVARKLSQHIGVEIQW